MRQHYLSLACGYSANPLHSPFMWVILLPGFDRAGRAGTFKRLKSVYRRAMIQAQTCWLQSTLKMTPDNTWGAEARGQRVPSQPGLQNQSKTPPHSTPSYYTHLQSQRDWSVVQTEQSSSRRPKLGTHAGWLAITCNSGSRGI